MNQALIGEKLRTLRVKNGLTQEELAEILNVTNRSISRWENGRSLPDISIIIELSEYYDVSLEYILSNATEDSAVRNNDEIAMLNSVSDYSREERGNLLKELHLGLIIIAICYSALIVSHLFGRNSDVLQSVISTCSIVGLSQTCICTTRVRQLLGDLNKEKYRSFKRKADVALAILLAILTATLIFLLRLTQ